MEEEERVVVVIVVVMRLFDTGLSEVNRMNARAIRRRLFNLTKSSGLNHL